jgi:hypothetical protein
MDMYMEGLYGPLIIHDPQGDLYKEAYTVTDPQTGATSVNEWTWMLADWYNNNGTFLRSWFLSAANPGAARKLSCVTLCLYLSASPSSLAKHAVHYISHLLI